MGWIYRTSQERVGKHLQELGDIEVKAMAREMKLENLTEKKCRRIYGAHVYTYLSGFPDLASVRLESEGDFEKYKRTIQAVHLYQREVSRIVEDGKMFDAARIHFQGIKLHGLIYRPIENAEKIAAKALLLLLVQDDFVRHVFNPAYPKLDDMELMGGADIGHAIGTRNGEKGDRELLFLGSPANHAAKIMRPGLLRVAARLYDKLPCDLQAWCSKQNDGDYLVSAPCQDALDAALEEYDIEWDRKASAKRLEDDKTQFPLCDIEYSDAKVKVDFDLLSIRNNKRLKAVSLFADVSGFTAFIDAADTEAKQQVALRVFHLIRREMAVVVGTDYEGVRIQFQGDRVQAVFHVPVDDEAKYCEEAVSASGGLQSSLEDVIKPMFPEMPVVKALKLAIGCDSGRTLGSSLGTRGHRDRICLGRPVEDAAEREEDLDGGQTGISAGIYNELPKALQGAFCWDEARECYVASNLTTAAIQDYLDAEPIDAGAPVIVRPGSGGACVKPTKPGTCGPGVIPVASSYGPGTRRGRWE